MLTPKKTTNALGIIFPNSYDALVPELSNVRLMASIPFASRYRMIDFILSSMVNNDITNIAVIVRNNYFSLMDHLGSGREWDLTRKNGGLHLFPPYAEKGDTVYNGRVDALAHALGFLRTAAECFVCCCFPWRILSAAPTIRSCTLDFRAWGCKDYDKKQRDNTIYGYPADDFNAGGTPCTGPGLLGT